MRGKIPVGTLQRGIVVIKHLFLLLKLRARTTVESFIFQLPVNSLDARFIGRNGYTAVVIYDVHAAIVG